MKNLLQFILAILFCLLFSDSVMADFAKRGEVDVKRNRLIGYILSKQLPVLHFSDKKLDKEISLAAFDLFIKQLDYQKRFLVQDDITVLSAFAPHIGENLAAGRITLPETGYDILGEKIDLVEKMVVGMLANDRIELVQGPSGSGGVTEPTTYIIKPGDTLYNIANQFDSVAVEDLKRVNKIDSPASLKVGREIRIDRVRPGIDGQLYVGNFNVLIQEDYETDPDKINFAKDFDALKDRWRKVLKMQIVSAYLDLQEEQKEAKEKAQGDTPVPDFAVSQSEKQLWKEAIEKVQKRNKNFFNRLHQETLQDHYDRYFNCVTRAFGPHTNYIPPAGKEQFDINMRGSLEGIGALLRESDGFIKVVRIIPGSASARQGRLKAEDTILEVAQEGEEPVDITEMRLRDAVRLIRGPKGEAVTLTVKKPDGSKEYIRIIRDVVQIEETFVRSSIIESENGRKTGYIYIPSFYRDFEGNRNGGIAKNSTDDTRKEIQKLKEQYVDGIVLDLRDDGGGALIDAVDITGLFIESGPVVQVKNSFGESRILSDKNGSVYYNGPLVVLVNKFSASASEIVAAALQDYERAVIVGGKHTHGKGTVQTIINLNENIPLLHLRKYDDLGALKVMIQKFYRVNGSSTQYKGVEPDIVLPNLYEHIKSGERYLDYSLPWDSIDPVEYSKWSGIRFDVDTLRTRSLKRAATSEGLEIIREEAEKAEKKSEQTAISIHLEDMRQKRQEARVMREKVGEHFSKYRDEEESEGEADADDEADSTDSEKRWTEQVNNDPYIREAVNIVGDIIKFSGK